ncbi:MAG: glycosyltransferase family 39 protein, partial [Victivallales bacterium]|nr:glycosyltransferase family 39 protein [Victivallales bacterium]
MAKQPDTTAAISFIRRRFSLILLAITGAAVILRFAACMELADTGMVIRPPSTTDMATYKELALAVRQGNFPPFFDYQPFYYVIFLPLAWIFSPSGAILPVHLLQSLTGAATVWLCGASAARLFGRKGGIIAALLLALSCFHIFYTPYLLLEVVFAFWSAMVLWSGLKAIEPDSRWYWSLISGLSLSCAMLTRGSALLWLPGVLLLLFLGKRRKLKSALLPCGIMVLAFILPVLPFAVHNTRAVGKLSGASVAGSKVLILGNSPEAPAGGLEYPRSYHQWMSEEENGGTPASVNMRRWIFSRPLDFLELTFRKLLLFWDSGEIPNNVSFVPHADRSTVLQLPILLPWGIIAMPALAGILLLLRHFGSRRRALLLWMCGIIWLATA